MVDGMETNSPSKRASEAISDGESDEARRAAAKKRKTSRACDRCNVQHQPCDNAHPKCSVCDKAGADCTYKRPIRKRGPRSGYTGQNGERLLAIILQARPDFEDLVLQILRGGTYGNSGVSNIEYLRNNDNQTELVNKFNESRIGRLIHFGETPDLRLPPLDQELPALTSQPQSGSSFGQPPTLTNLRGNSTRPMSERNRRNSVSSTSTAAHSSIVNPHGAPQNPGDIYLQSDDIRKRTFNPINSMNSNSNTGDGYDFPGPQGPSSSSFGLELNQSPAPLNGYAGNGLSINGRGIPESVNNFIQSNSMSQQPRPSEINAPVSVRQETLDGGFNGHLGWLDPISASTLLNLGFMPGEGMAEDFLELCENPDPIESTSVGPPVSQNEDQEAVWRRLVLKGRFT